MPVARFVFDVPLRGSLWALHVTAVLYLAAVIGVGLFISSLSATQQQAILGGFLFAAPATLLSGFATPIVNMPHWLQVLTLVTPAALLHGRGARRVLEGIPPGEVLRNALSLALIALVTLTSAAWLFRRRTE